MDHPCLSVALLRVFAAARNHSGSGHKVGQVQGPLHCLLPVAEPPLSLLCSHYRLELSGVVRMRGEHLFKGYRTSPWQREKEAIQYVTQGKAPAIVLNSTSVITH